MTEYSRDEMVAALAGFRDARFAELFTIMFGLAAERHPEEIKRAVGQVFDLHGVEEAHRRIMAALQETLERETEIADRQRQVLKKLDRLDERIDRMNLWIDHAAQRARKVTQTQGASHG